VKSTGINIAVEPNPASSWVAFNYRLPVNTSSAIITISDAEGKLVNRIIISGEQGQEVWDVRNIKSGAYIYNLESGDMSQKGKLIIK